MREYLTYIRSRIRGEIVTVALISLGIAAMGSLGLYLYGGSKESEGSVKTELQQYKAEKTYQKELQDDKNKYLEIQMPKRRKYEEAVKKKGNARERAEATFDMFDRSRK